MQRLVASLAALVLIVSAALPASAAVPPVSRLAGPDRYATAAAVSRSAFGPGVAVAFVVSGTGFADALAAGPAAARRRGPVLLVEPERIPTPTGDELRRLAPGAIVVVGGRSVISDTVVRALDGFTAGPVTRIAGEDRFETAALVSHATFGAGVASAYVANGTTFPDALPGGAAAGASGGPLLLVTRDAVSAPVAAELRRLAPRLIVILGGGGAVDEGVEAHLRSLAPEVGRLGGADRYETSALVAAGAFPGGGGTVFLATGRNYPDALAGAPVAALAPGPVMLVRTNCIPVPVRDQLQRISPQRVVLLGGLGALYTNVERLIACPAGQRERPVSVAPAPDPVYPDDAPDPQILRVGSTWFMYTTGTTWGNRIGVLTSTSATSGWRTVNGRSTGSTALPSIPSWQQPDTQWAPGVYAWGGRYIMFYAAQARAHGKWCLSTASADSPAGPFTDRSAGPLLCQVELGGSIDPHPFIDTEGRPWLHWKNNDGSSADVSRVWAVPLAGDGQSLAGPATEVLAKNSELYPWQNTVDNPQMVLIDGVHYLFFSGGDWESERYVVGYAVCSGPTGPCTQPNPDPILASYGTAWGPAGGTVEVDAAGQWWMVYHAFDRACATYACGSRRLPYVAPLHFG